MLTDESNPNVGMHCNNTGLDIIAHNEGYKEKAYLDPKGIWTIGYGHTNGVKPGDTCTRQQANDWLIEDVIVAEDTIARLVTVPLNSNQFSALVSLIYNIGSGNFSQSTALRLLNAGRISEVPAAMCMWNRIGKEISVGLDRRRHAEAWLFTTPPAS